MKPPVFLSCYDVRCQSAAAVRDEADGCQQRVSSHCAPQGNLREKADKEQAKVREKTDKSIFSFVQLSDPKCRLYRYRSK